MPIKVKHYEQFVKTNARIGLLDDGYNAIGLCGEAGEVAEWTKKAVYRKDKRHTKEMLKLELGDVLHYLTRIALRHGWTLKDIMEGNVVKINQRQRRATR